MPEKRMIPDITELVSSFFEDVYRYALRLSRRPDHAEELTQQTFLIAQERLAQLRDTETAKGWLLAIVRNTYFQSRRRHRPACESEQSFDLTEFAAREPEDKVDRERLHHALDNLPGEYRTVLLMYYFEDLSYREISDALQLPAGTVMSRLSRAKHRLKSTWLNRAPVRDAASSLGARADFHFRDNEE